MSPSCAHPFVYQVIGDIITEFDPPSDKPPRPDPWATTRPREGLRDNNQARIVSLSPSVNFTPRGNVMVPVPYPVVDFAGHDDGYTSSVRFTGQRAMVLRSFTQHAHGDAQGTGGGVVSGTVGGICEPIGHAPQVRAEGSPVVRHLDRFWMNNRNTVGVALFVRDTAVYPAPKDTDPLPGSARVTLVDARAPAFDRAPADLSPTPPTLLPGQPTSSTATPRPSGGAGVPVPRGGTGPWSNTLPNPMERLVPPLVEPFDRALGRPIGKNRVQQDIDELDQALQQAPTTDLSQSSAERGILQSGIDRLRREALPTGDTDRADEIMQETMDRLQAQEEREEEERKRNQPTPVPPPIAPLSDGNVRISKSPTHKELEDCGIRPHRINQGRCGAMNGASHHGMVDFPFRTGTRAQTERGVDHRQPNAPNLSDALTVCVPADLDDAHNSLHRQLDADVNATGVNGLTTFGDVKRLSFREIDDLDDAVLSPACKRIYKLALSAQYSMPDDTPLRASPYRPLPSSDNDVGRALSRAWRFTW